MLRSLRKLSLRTKSSYFYLQKSTFLTNDYKCEDAWNSQVSSLLPKKININDFYNTLDQNYSSKGVISAIDVDIFANVLNDSTYLEELKELLYKLRLSADTVNTLDSTHHATIRNFMKFDNTNELIDMLKDPLNFGIFLDDFTANILLDSLITSGNYEQAANIAGLVMLQEDYTNEITRTLCQYTSYKYIVNYVPPPPEPPEDKKKKVEEKKIRVKYLRNPYFDDHFDIKDTYKLMGKTLAWMSENMSSNLSNNLQIIGWLVYGKYEKLLNLCKTLSKISSFKIHKETIDLLKRECSKVEAEKQEILNECIGILTSVTPSQRPLEEAIKISIENAINKTQSEDISKQKQLFESWIQTRAQRIEEQTKRLDRVKRMELIQEKQKELQLQEQKLWFFENEDKIELEIEEKEKQMEEDSGKEVVAKSDEDYIPPEILPKRK